MAKRKTKAVPVEVLVEIDTWEPTFLGSFQKPNPKRFWSTSTSHVVSISGAITEPKDGAPAPRACVWFFPVARDALADPELESIGHAYFSGARDDTIDIHVRVERDCIPEIIAGCGSRAYRFGRLTLRPLGRKQYALTEFRIGSGLNADE